MERLAEISILVVCLGFFLYGISYAFRLWMRKNNITLSDITEPFRSISAFKSELKFLIPIIFGLFIVSSLFGDYRILGMSFPAFLVYILIRAFMSQKAEPPIESPKQFSTENFSCGHCGAQYNPENYRQDAAECICSQCGKPLQKKKLEFDAMNIIQLLEYSEQKIGNFTMNTAIEMTKRLFSIAYFDYGVSDKERQMAEKLLGAVIKDVENSLSSNPEALQAYRAANKFMIDKVELFGIGSLAWKIGASGVSDEEVIKMIINPLSGPLIPNFLKTMPEETWNQTKGDVIKALILDRRRGGESNAVLILSGLIAGTDLVAWNIMNPSERSILTGVSKNYKNARDVLVRYGLLPSKSSALPMTPRMPDDELAGIVLMSAHDRNDSIWPSNIIKTYELFDENQKAFISITLFIIKVIIFLDLFNDVYGRDVALKIENNVMDNLKESNEKEFKTFLGAIRYAEEMALRETSRLGIDKTIASGLMDFYIPKGLSDEDQMELRDIVSEIYNIERRSSLHKFRFYLRFFANKGITHAESLKKYGDLYRYLGSRVGELEKELLLEDWIGDS